MTITFGDTFQQVKECFQDESVISTLVPNLEYITIIRDVHGKIRLFLEPITNVNLEESEIQYLNELLSQKLGKYYGQDIWLPQQKQDGYQALIKVIKNERRQHIWENEEETPRWYILERHIAKQAWTNNNSGQIPWGVEFVYDGHKPAIVSFFSFKGGVGRTTALVGTALTLARKGHRVAIVDLDLEAPGLSTIFSGDDSNSGVIDYLLEKKIQQDQWKISPSLQSINDNNLLGDSGETLRLLSAGCVDKNYLEKLARLDFQNLVEGEFTNTITDLLTELQSSVDPLDFILMDARAGFHDIGGLAISALSHAVVVFGTQSRQSWAGITHVIRHLAQPSPEERVPLILVHAMAPALSLSGREGELIKFRDQAYTVFQENYYYDDELIPNSGNTDAPFTPIVVPYNDTIRGDIALFPFDSSPEDSNRLSNLVNILTDSPYQDIAKKLCDQFGRNFENPLI
jgi:MinD-like ATPase involved in chromosome partitioning or flagellar assembly